MTDSDTVKVLRDALVGIQDSPFCDYFRGDVEGMPALAEGERQYRMGVTDGHLFCSADARKALEACGFGS